MTIMPAAWVPFQSHAGLQVTAGASVKAAEPFWQGIACLARSADAEVPGHCVAHLASMITIAGPMR